MQIDGVATLVMNNMLREAIKRSQQNLADAQLEFSTGRHADVGLTLGAGTGRDLMWRAQLSELQSLSDGNNLAATRLDLTQQALSQMRDVASTFMATITGARGAADGQATAKAAADAALKSLTSLLNTSYGGQYIFSGTASDQKPMADYPGSPPGAAKTAVDAAFLASFGMTQSSAGVAAITPAAMQSFLDAGFDALFAPAPWGITWSQASDTAVTTRIDTGQRIDSGVTANADAFRQLAQAFTMVLDLGEGQLNQTSFATIVDQAARLTGQGILGIGNVQSQLGISQNRISTATEHMTLRINAITSDLTNVEGVDKYEAATRANSLQTQLEASYALTGRIARLSILNYI
jgi:flagellar hook-associated protein 3 FlgL